MSDKTEKAALERRIDELCVELGHAQLNRDMWHDRAEDMRNRLLAAQAENAKLRERNTTQKQTIQAYRDESREWREVAERAQAENDKLRELVRDMMVAWWTCDNERCPRHDKRCEEGKFCAFDECARDLGIEVGE